MAKLAKLLQAAAGAAGGAGLDVDEVFSTDLWSGTGATTNTITNGIDISGEGGLVWVHSRSRGGEQHILTDTENGQGKALDSSSTSSLSTTTESVQNLNSDGYSFSGDLSPINRPNDTYVGWTFRKAPKFFDVVKYQGNNESAQYVNHNLGVTPGCIILKSLDSSGPWFVWHRGLSSASHSLRLNTTAAESVDTNYEIGINASDTQFYVDTGSDINYSTSNYVAYLFAHNDGDGEFGPDSDADIIKCGSYTGGTSGIEIDLGFEPQWLLIKSVDSANSWFCVDNMRGFDGDNGSNSTSTVLRLDRSNSENTASFHIAQLLPNGFTINSVNYESNASGEDYIYIAIRRGPMAVPTDATDVFGLSKQDKNTTSFPVDMMIFKGTGGSDSHVYSRLTGGTRYLEANNSNAEAGSSDYGFDDMEGTQLSGWGTSFIFWNWKRAPNYFDVVCYTGTGVAGQSHNHNLGVAPEMIWIKNRDSATSSWQTLHKLSDGTHVYGVLNTTAALNSAVQHKFGDGTNFIAPTATQFSVINNSAAGKNGNNYIAYLFASVDGVSKVGSFTYTQGVAQNIDCGFSSGARFVLYKRASGTSGWTVFDTERGIVAGNDPMLFLNTTSAEDSSYDFIDPYSGGFALSDSTANLSGDYIFYAIA